MTRASSCTTDVSRHVTKTWLEAWVRCPQPTTCNCQAGNNPTSRVKCLKAIVRGTSPSMLPYHSRATNGDSLHGNVTASSSSWRPAMRRSSPNGLIVARNCCTGIVSQVLPITTTCIAPTLPCVLILPLSMSAQHMPCCAGLASRLPYVPHLSNVPCGGIHAMLRVLAGRLCTHTQGSEAVLSSKQPTAVA